MLICISHIKSQENIKEDLILPTPDASSLGKYGQYPVSLNNGLVQISIPIYTIDLPLIKIPVTISYHASGIKVNEISTAVGLGWTLNTGGVISRCVKSNPDILKGMTQKVYNVNFINNMEDGAKANILWNYYDGERKSYQDLESDIFYYNVCGLSGSFRFDTDGQLVQMPLTNNRIEFTSDNTFKITGSNGTTYFFMDKEFGVQAIKPERYITSWYLTGIETIDGKNISFYYLNDTTPYTEYYPNFIMKRPHNTYMQTLFNSHESVSTTENTLLLKAIQFPDGKIDFMYEADRKDKRKYRLSKISVSNNSNKYIKKYMLNQSYFNSERLKLDAIQVLNSEDIKISNYEFKYNTSILLPPYYKAPNYPIQSNMENFGQDVWGYYNGIKTNKSLMNYNVNKIPAYITSNYPPADRSVNPLYAQACILKKVKYPTGGYTEFEYEGNVDESGDNLGGVRIKEMKSYARRDGTPIVHSYEYKASRMKPIVGTGELGEPYTQGEIIEDKVEFSDYYLSRPNLDINSWVNYFEAIEYDGFPKNCNGKTVYGYYTLDGDIGWYDFSHCEIPQPAFTTFIPIPSYYNKEKLWGKGRLAQVDVYARKGNQLSLLKSTKNDYTLFEKHSVNTGLKVFANFNTRSQYLPAPYIGYLMKAKQLFQYADVHAETGLLKLTKTEEINYFEGTTVSQSTDFFYDRLNNQYEVTSTREKSSDGTVLKNFFLYPNDLKDSNAIYNEMSSKNILTPIIEQSESIDDKIIKSIYTEYRQINDNIFAPWYVNIKKGGGTSQRYISYLYNSQYDNRGNILEIQKRGSANVTYIWGYNKTLPVAKIYNCSYNPIYTNSSLMAYLDQLQNYTDLSDISIRNNLNSLNSFIRNNLPAGAKIETYTYKPMVGITSLTTVSNITTYYDYDSLGRLIESYIIKNGEKKILNSNEYHYVEQ